MGYMKKATVQANDVSMRIMYRILRKVALGLPRLLKPLLPQKVYMRSLVNGLRLYGMDIVGEPIYIAPTCWFDGTDYGVIKLEHKVVISSNVSILTHDFSIARVRDALAKRDCRPEVSLVRGIRIGANSFIGRGVILMPGADIGKNCIVGAGSVVRGGIPDNSIVLGNPAQVVGNSLEWGASKLQELGIDP